MKNILIIITITLSILSFFLIANPKANAVTINCSGDRSAVCAKITTVGGTTWEVYGDKAVIQV